MHCNMRAKKYSEGGRASVPKKLKKKGPKQIKLGRHTDKDESKFKSNMKRQYLATGAFADDKGKGSPVQKANKFAKFAAGEKFKGSVNKKGIQKSTSNVGDGVSPSRKRRR